MNSGVFFQTTERNYILIYARNRYTKHDFGQFSIVSANHLSASHYPIWCRTKPHGCLPSLYDTITYYETIYWLAFITCIYFDTPRTDLVFFWLRERTCGVLIMITNVLIYQPYINHSLLPESGWRWQTGDKLNTSKPRQNCRHFPDDVFTCMFLYKFRLGFHRSLLLRA